MIKHVFFAVCMIGLYLPSTQADLLDDFENINTNVTARQVGSAPGPLVVTNINGNVTNRFLRLANDTINGQNNRYAYDQTVTGEWQNITMAFDFRMTSIGAAAADGLGLILLPISDWGTTGDGPGITSEEPNAPRSLGFGIDAHPATSVNDFSLHWDGHELVSQIIPTNTVNIDNGLFHRAILEIEPFGNGAYARAYVITNSLATNAGPKTLVFDTIVPNMLPYENRAMFSGRTGGLNMDIDIDNVSILYSNAYTNAIETITTNVVYQDFDLAGGTRTFSIQHETTGLTTTFYRPGPQPRDDGDARGTYVRLIHDGVNTSRNSISLDHAGPSLTPARLQYEFDFRADATNAPADGWGLLLLPTRDYGHSGNGPDVGLFEKPNRAGTLSFGFDMFPEGSGVNDVSVHWNAAEITNVTLDATTEIDLNNSIWNRAEIYVDQVTSGAVVNLLIIPDVDSGTSTPVQAMSDVFVPGYVHYEHRLQLGGRTGGSYHSLDVDNILQTLTPYSPANGPTMQNFEAGQTYYEVWQNPNSAEIRTEILNDGGANENYLRLTMAGIQNHRNSITFDHTQQGSQTATGLVTSGQFDFRVIGTDANNPADGLAMMLIPTNTYGTTGPGVFYNNSGNIEIEKPNYPGVLGIGIDVHNESQGINDVSLHWNGAQISNVTLPDTVIDLDTNVFHHLSFNIDWTSTGALVNVDMAHDVLGNPGPTTNVISSFITDLMPYDYRVEFGARTGGAHANIDLDNIQVVTSSEEDSDNDNLLDEWEIQNFGDLVTTDGLPGQDFDLDTFDDLNEFLAGTQPTNALSFLRVQAAPDNNGQRIEWASVDGKLYRIWRTDDPRIPANWNLIQSNINATAPINIVTDASSLTNRWIYRVELQLPAE